MSELESIEETLRSTNRRRRWLAGWKGLSQGAFVGGLVWLLVFLVYKLFPIPTEILQVAAGVGIACLPAGFLIGIWPNLSLLETARWVDDERQLKERISTALELKDAPEDQGKVSGEWKRLVLLDAVKHVGEVQPRQLLPFQFPKVLRWALLVMVLGAGMGFIPEYRTEAFKKKEKEAAHVREVGKKLVELTRRNLAKKPPLLPPTRQALEQVVELGDQLSKAKLTRSDALRDLTSVTDKIREQARELGENPPVKSLEKAARESSQPGSSPAELQKQMDALKKSMGNTPSDPNKMDKLQQKLQALQKSAANLPNKDSAAGQAARQQMAQALSQLTQEAREMGMSLPDLEKAMASLENNQTDLFLRDMEAAFNDLEKMKTMAKAMQRMQQQASKLGKDLAEQLEKGQAQAAQQTLQKMIKQLQSAELSPQQQQQILDEVNKAVNPAGEYGKVAEHLKEAMKQLKSGQKPGAAQSLAEAKDELKKLMQQMADAQSLQAALDALERAQAAVASGKTWEQAQGGYCNQCGGSGCSACQNKGKGWGKGGKPGSGVGTWADENGWTYIPQTDGMVDNSGIQRPDMDARGLTERPEDLNDNLLPTKVKGQMSPGGSMPSITLKGVHIKGQSTVQFEEAAQAAQAEAQSAINQDKVPRPYLNSVRDYFDDFKE